MKNTVLQDILQAKKNNQKLLAILLDPDKLSIAEIPTIIEKINNSNAHYIFIGGSTVVEGLTEKCVDEIKKHTLIPLVLFPGDYTQLNSSVDAVLFLSLVSGRNPEYLIEQQIKSVPFFKKNKTECIPTAYLLIDGGTITATQKVSKTNPIDKNNIELIVNTAIASELQGKKLIYLEAGSGATYSVSAEIIKQTSQSCSIPIIVGGGLRTKSAINNAYKNGADIVVVGTAFEEDNFFFENI